MKRGRIAKHLEEVLDDPAARKELRRMLIRGEGGRLRVGPKAFELTMDVRVTVPGTSSGVNGRR